MSFFPKWALGTDRDSKPEPKRKREYAKPSKPNKEPHKHDCQTCGFPFKCNFANCSAPGVVDACYTCRGSNFQTFDVKS